MIRLSAELLDFQRTARRFAGEGSARQLLAAYERVAAQPRGAP